MNVRTPTVGETSIMECTANDKNSICVPRQCSRWYTDDFESTWRDVLEGYRRLLKWLKSGDEVC